MAVQMPRYQCHKKVWALKISAIANVLPDGSAECAVADDGHAPITIAKEVLARYFPKPGDYYVVYDDGYKSISPAKAFEDGYTKI